MRPPLFLTFLCSIVRATLDEASVKQLYISKASQIAFHKYLDETCQKEDTMKLYFEWEEHEFVTSLRNELLPDTKDGDLTAFARSNLIHFLPVSPLAADPRRSLCQKGKKISRNVTLALTDSKDSSSAFQDYIIDLVMSR